MPNINIPISPALLLYLCKPSIVNPSFHTLLEQTSFSKNNLIRLIESEGEEHLLLIRKASEVQTLHTGNNIYLRGLIEYSNRCTKDCLYCGIRQSNSKVIRYTLDDKQVLKAADFAWKNSFGSIVLQAGELTGARFIARIEKLLKQIGENSNHELGITLSLGEQTEETYFRWRNAGAHRYLLRIETSNPNLYRRIHPNTPRHRFEHRLHCIQTLQKVGYQTGTGVMIGLPFQTTEDLANDLLFFKSLEIDMVGMGPYLEHQDTPLHQYQNLLWSKAKRIHTAFNMIAALRLLMPNINIAASTALQSIDPLGREKALKGGANVIMPNITPALNRKNYALYNNKPCVDEDADDCKNCLLVRIEMTGRTVGYNQKGGSLHYKKPDS